MDAIPHTDTLPGRSCPLSYRYSPAVFSRPADLHAEALYVVGLGAGGPEFGGPSNSRVRGNSVMNCENINRKQKAKGKRKK